MSNQHDLSATEHFKEYCALLFVKGALLQDAHGILVQQKENVQAARQIRFTNLREIVEMEPILIVYIINEAIEVEKALSTLTPPRVCKPPDTSARSKLTIF